MPAGRPQKGTTNRLASLAQFHFLCGSFAVDSKGLASWLRTIPEGGMSDRDIARFLHHESTLQRARCRVIDRYAPGFNYLSSLPWQELSLGKRDPKLIRHAIKELEALCMPGTQRVSALQSVGPKYRSIATNEQWQAVHAFFSAVADYRLGESKETFEGFYRLSRQVMATFSTCLSHPTMGLLKRELAYCTNALLNKNLFLSFRLLLYWSSFERRHDISDTTDLPSTLKYEIRPTH